MAHATTAQLAAYLGTPEGDLPADAPRLLDRASDIIDRVTRGRSIGTLGGYAAAQVVKATCAQAEFWIMGDGESSDISGGVQSYRAGSVSVTRAQGSAGSSSDLNDRLAPRARDALFLAGLLNAAVPARAMPFEGNDL